MAAIISGVGKVTVSLRRSHTVIGAML